MDGLKAMDAEQLREHGHKMVDFIADYYKNIESFPVLSQVQVSVFSFGFCVVIRTLKLCSMILCCLI